MIFTYKDISKYDRNQVLVKNSNSKLVSHVEIYSRNYEFVIVVGYVEELENSNYFIQNEITKKFQHACKYVMFRENCIGFSHTTYILSNTPRLDKIASLLKRINFNPATTICDPETEKRIN